MSIAANFPSQFRERLGTHNGIAGDNAMQRQSGLTADQRAVKRSPSQAVSDHNRRDHVVSDLFGSD
jgi:hypothetical protein